MSEEELDLIQIEEALEPSFSGMQDMLNEVYIKDAIPLLIAEVKRLRQDRAEVRRDAHEEVLALIDKEIKDWENHFNSAGSDIAMLVLITLRALIADRDQGQGKE